MRVSETDYFAHYGVKGMRWGIRKERPSSGRSGRLGSKKTGIQRTSKVEKPDTRSEARKQSDEIRKKRVSEMSDEELKQVIGRMNMERQYKQLNTELYQPGKKFAMGALKTVGNMGVAAVGGYMVKTGGKSIGSAAAKLAGKFVRRGVTRAMRFG